MSAQRIQSLLLDLFVTLSLAIAILRVVFVEARSLFHLLEH